MEPEIAVLIAGIGGAFIGIGGQIIGNLINHKKEIERRQKEFVLKEKIESFKKIHSLIYEIQKKTITLLIESKGNKSYIKGLISEIRNESFLFSNQKTLNEINEGANIMYSILDNSQEIIKVLGEKKNINQQEINKLVNQISDARTKIIASIRKELNI